MKLSHAALGALTWLGAAPGLLAAPGDDGARVVPFEALGKSFLEKHCPQATPQAPCPLDDVLARRCVRMDVGLFELFFPADHLEDKKRAEMLPEIAGSLVDLQQEWIRWLKPGDEAAQGALAELESVGTWIDQWKATALRDLAEGGGASLFAALQAPEEVVQAEAAARAFLLDAERMPITPRNGTRLRFLCSPTRRDFMELVGYTGLVDPALREQYWIDGVDQWTQFWSGWTFVLGLEYAPWDDFDPEFRSGQSLTRFDETGLQELVVEQAALGLLYLCFQRPEPRHEEKALAMNLTIDVVGQINTVDGEGAITASGATTQPYERFVPGGASEGGVLPAISAAPFNMILDNHWRVGHGRDHFAESLRKGQKAGAKRAAKDKENPLRKDKTAHFELDVASAGRHVVTAPFLSSAAYERPYPPPEFLNDYREFFRAYKSGFLHWLRTEGVAEDPDASAAKFRELLVAMGRHGGSKTFEEVAREVYGVPLSSSEPAPEPEPESLEWRYLAWLAKGK